MTGLTSVQLNGTLIAGGALCKHFGGIAAVDGVDFSVAAGDLIGLIGPNGSGKTTLINVLTGHMTPESGDVVVRGPNDCRADYARWPGRS